MTTIYLSLSAQVAKSTFFMKSPVLKCIFILDPDGFVHPGPDWGGHPLPSQRHHVLRRRRCHKLRGKAEQRQGYWNSRVSYFYFEKKITFLATGGGGWVGPPSTLADASAKNASFLTWHLRQSLYINSDVRVGS